MWRDIFNYGFSVGCVYFYQANKPQLLFSSGIKTRHIDFDFAIHNQVLHAADSGGRMVMKEFTKHFIK